MQTFIPINGTIGRYELSPGGQIRSWYFKGKLRDHPKMLRPGPSHGYLSVVLCVAGNRKTHFIHRLLAEHFIPNPNNYRTINHKDGNRANNALDNLEWCTHSHNSQHSIDSLNHHHGCRHSKAKFVEKDLRKIFSLRFKKKLTANEIAREMGVTAAAIVNICAGRRYKKEFARIVSAISPNTH